MICRTAMCSSAEQWNWQCLLYYKKRICTGISSLSEGRFTLPLGTLYPVLYRFVEGGLLSDRDEIVGKRLRKYYHLELRGREYYRDLLSEYRNIARGIDLITKGCDGDDF